MTQNGNLWRLGLLVLVVVPLLVGPYWADRGTMRLLIEVFYFLALAQLWNLLAGYSGLISVGQQAFVGLGGYIIFSLAMFAGVPVIWGLPLAGLATAVIAWPTPARMITIPHWVGTVSWIKKHRTTFAVT